ncbi:hypothetical protein EDD11_006171 [Mortierella claussenii]|nr:hypothetical protein EDD11_006171 [Mortierella claussenii]
MTTLPPYITTASSIIPSPSYTTSISSYSYPYSTSSINSHPIVSPALPSHNSSSSGISTGGIIGIVLAALIALLAGLVGIFLVKKRRRQILHWTSNTLFNPVNLDMQENYSQHPRKDSDFMSGSGQHPNSMSSAGLGLGAATAGAGTIHSLSGRESVDPLNGSGRMGASGASATAASESLYPYDMGPQAYNNGYGGNGGDANGLGYMPPNEPGSYGRYESDYGMSPLDEEAMAAYQYQRQFYNQQMQQQRQDLDTSVQYFGGAIGSRGVAPYCGQGYVQDEEGDAMQREYLYRLQQQQNFGAGGSVGVNHGRTTSLTSPSTAMISPAEPSAAAAVPVASENDAYVDAESDAHENSKSEVWPKSSNRQSIASNSTLTTTDPRSPKRNPQLAVTDHST